MGWLALAGCESPPPGMLLIPGGDFVMGTNEVDPQNRALALGLDKPWFADASPEREVYLPDFYIDQFEVTNKDFYIFCQATDHKPPRYWGGPKFPDDQDDYPVTHVSFFDAAAYAEWAGKRLPSEAEWEKAARGHYGSIYPWGNEFDIHAANISPSPRMKTGSGLQPVGRYPQGSSPFGVNDMVGNAWEWVWEYYAPYPDSTYTSPDYEKKLVVIRGLSHMGVGHFSKEDYIEVIRQKARASYRERINPFARKADLGFRCVREKKTFWEAWFGKEKTRAGL
ncbi:MAG: hypothetical protein COV67_06975 [Nitrospinae bacterium CG11_big_fil_rev_8_21_14_0_20_56_8]|nr:MAG: hypothetical protein COV67_06975 [Nitrospinae bacterium CG11_big_fil_rev_8_21_14_0_20_56_8]